MRQAPSIYEMSAGHTRLNRGAARRDGGFLRDSPGRRLAGARAGDGVD